jgi:hypothetical protein
MKTQVIVLALLLGASAFAQQAQVQVNQGAAAQYDEATNTVVEVQPKTIDRNPIVILNNNPPRVQDQGTSLVEASPLVESQADRMRKQRAGLEVNTEQRIVEKLEQSRMEDERERADRLFGNALAKPTPAPAPAPVVEPVPVVVAPQPVQVVQPAPQVVEAKEDKVDVKSEIRMAMAELQPKAEEPKTTYYVGGLIGTAEYQDAVNVKGNVATGISVGAITPDNFVVEGAFLYSDYEVDDMTQAYPWKDLTQYSIQGAVKYQILPGKLRPFAGAVLGFTHRKATNSDMSSPYYGGTAGAPDGEGTSNAFDVGLTGGLDLALSKQFSIGAEARYMHNISYKREYSDRMMGMEDSSGITPIEELDYYSVTVNGKVTF